MPSGHHLGSVRADALLDALDDGRSHVEEGAVTALHLRHLLDSCPHPRGLAVPVIAGVVRVGGSVVGDVDRLLAVLQIDGDVLRLDGTGGGIFGHRRAIRVGRGRIVLDFGLAR